jgi:hypothetical protein
MPCIAGSRIREIFKGFEDESALAPLNELNPIRKGLNLNEDE